MRRSLAALILANATSLTGNVVAIVAIPWFVLETSGSSGRTAIAAFCTALPLGIGALVGGILGAAAYGVLARVLPARRIFGSIRIAYPIVCAALIALPRLAGAIAVLFLIGLVPGIGVPLYQLVLQAETAAAVRGRVFSVFGASLSLLRGRDRPARDVRRVRGDEPRAVGVVVAQRGAVARRHA